MLFALNDLPDVIGDAAKALCEPLPIGSFPACDHYPSGIRLSIHLILRVVNGTREVPPRSMSQRSSYTNSRRNAADVGFARLRCGCSRVRRGARKRGRQAGPLPED